MQQITLNNDITQSTFNEDSGEGKGKKKQTKKNRHRQTNAAFI